jgi:hypothetical protein
MHTEFIDSWKTFCHTNKYRLRIREAVNNFPWSLQRSFISLSLI